MRDAAMMLESRDGPGDVRNDVEVGRLGREHDHRGRERGLAVQSGARDARARQEMSKGIQAMSVTGERKLDNCGLQIAGRRVIQRASAPGELCRQSAIQNAKRYGLLAA